MRIIVSLLECASIHTTAWAFTGMTIPLSYLFLFFWSLSLLYNGRLSSYVCVGIRWIACSCLSHTHMHSPTPAGVTQTAKGHGSSWIGNEASLLLPSDFICMKKYLQKEGCFSFSPLVTHLNSILLLTRCSYRVCHPRQRCFSVLDKNSEWPGYYGAVIVFFFFCLTFIHAFQKLSIQHWLSIGQCLVRWFIYEDVKGYFPLCTDEANWILPESMRMFYLGRFKSVFLKCKGLRDRYINKTELFIFFFSNISHFNEILRNIIQIQIWNRHCMNQGCVTSTT